MAAPTVDIDGIREPVSGSLIYVERQLLTRYQPRYLLRRAGSLHPGLPTTARAWLAELGLAS